MMNTFNYKMWFLPMWMAVFALVAPAFVAAEDTPDPPRVARISAIEGSASLWTDDENEWQAVDVNSPVLGGDRVYAGVGSLVEIQLGDDVFVRLNEQTYISLPYLEEDFVRIEVEQGSVNVNAKETEYDRPPLEVMASTFLATMDEPANVRFDVQPTGAEIAVQRGRLNVNIDKERFIRVERGEKLIAPRADPDTYTKMPISPADAFDKWVDIRDAATATISREPQVSTRISGYQDLDRYGEWVNVPTYGTVWRPATSTVDWAPYREGYWTWRYRHGWVWVSYEPWGWAPYHYGRWVHTNRYNWVWTPHYAAYVGPSYHYRRPYWYPALVSFTYADRGDYFRFSVGGGRSYYNDSIGWFPLGYNDPYYWNWGYYNNHHRNHYYYDDYHRGFHRRGGNTFINNGNIVINDYDYDNYQVKNAVTVMPRKDFTASVYDRKTGVTVQTSARRAVALGENAMNSVPDVRAVRTETQKTKLAMKNSSQPLTSPSRVVSDRSFMSSSKPRSITTDDAKPVAMTTTKPARLRDAETPRMKMSNPAIDEKRVKVAQRSTVDVKTIRQSQAASPSRSGQAAGRVETSPSRTVSPDRTTSPNRNPSTVAPQTRSRISAPSVSTPGERSSRSVTKPNSPSRVGQPQERSVQQAPSTVKERSSRAQELRSRRTVTPPNSQAARNRQRVTEPSMSMNWSEAARNRSYSINSRSRYESESGSRAITPPVRVQAPRNSGSVTSTPRTYNLQGRGAYSVSPSRSEANSNVRVYNRSGQSSEPSRSIPQRETSVRRSNIQTFSPEASPQRSTSRRSSSPSVSSPRSSERSYNVSPSRSSSNRSSSVSPSRSSNSSSRMNSPSVSRSQPSRSISPSRSSSSSSRLSSPSVSPSRSSVGTSRASQMRSSSPTRSSGPTSSAAASRARRP
ncbi:MAG: hypothetical protein P9L94_12695 [Candidatus Hinthialibacter antarcticus]|nr:hypothetical protein [Candidatus Hinthialibacter antarcticus]